MAKLKVYSVFDAKVQLFAQPFFMRTRGEALRGWQDVCNDPSTQIAKYPDDFALMELGEYDEDSGRFENLATPLSLGLAIQFRREPSPAPAIQAPGLKESVVSGWKQPDLINSSLS